MPSIAAAEMLYPKIAYVNEWPKLGSENGRSNVGLWVFNLGSPRRRLASVTHLQRYDRKAAVDPTDQSNIPAWIVRSVHRHDCDSCHLRGE